ncbi:hypothetical protein BDC45DRAFT_18532 [Circinella umbellata]|nr:hypothetical protein BDC45DRAFT_18532 [Circinella umbellata]
MSYLEKEDEEPGVSKKIVVAEENDLTTSTDSTYGLSTKDDDRYEETKEDKEETKEERQVQQQFVDEVVDVSHLPREEEQVEDLLPEMIEASETGSFISQNITDTVSTPESEEPCVGRVRTYSAMAVFDHWTRAERHDYLQKSKECIFPDAIERLAELKPTDLTFRTVSDDIRPPSVVDASSFYDTQSTSSVLDNNSSGNSSDEYMVNQTHLSLVGPLGNSNGDVQHQPVPYTVSSFDGKISPQYMPPMTMAGRQNFPVLVYQVPYNGQGGPFVPGSPNGTGGYGITTAATDNQQQPMFIPAPMSHQQQFQGQPLPQQQQSQHPSMMNVYLLSPNQMLPPWPGMPPVNNNPANITTTNNHNHNHNNNQRRRR